MRLALGMVLATLLLVGCGVKGSNPNSNSPTNAEVLGEFVLDGRAELELVNNGYDPRANCIQMVKRSGITEIEFSNGVCSTSPIPVFILSVSNQSAAFKGVTIGSFDVVGTHFRLFELCSGPYDGVCLPKGNGSTFTTINLL